MRIFISYARGADSVRIDDLHDNLTDAVDIVWVDRELREAGRTGGTPFSKKFGPWTSSSSF